MAFAIPLRAQSPADLAAYKQMSLDQLMNLDVTSVSKQPEPYARAPAAIDVVTSDDIRRSGAASLPEALRLADNLEVDQENAYDWAISARGFNANLADKLLVLIDGRSVYTPLYGGVYWRSQDYLLADIDRIEVISGPGGTLWGANAVNGVINVMSKSAKDTQGALVQEVYGSPELEQTAVRYGASLGNGTYARVYGQYSSQGGEVLLDGTPASDAWNMRRTGFRLDSERGANAVTFQGDYYHGVQFLGAAGDGDASGGNLLGRWTRTWSEESSLSVQAYYDRTHLSQPFAASPPAPPYFTGFPASSLADDLDTYDVDVEGRFPWGSAQRFVVGMGDRYTHETDEDLSVVRFTPPVLDLNLYSGFAQDEIRLADDFHATIGSKLEHNDYTGLEVQPSIRFDWEFRRESVLWGAVTRAVRTPSRYDRDLQVVSGLTNAPAPYQFPADYLTGSKQFRSEDEIAYELGYRGELSPRLSASVSLFFNDYTHLRSTTATAASLYYPFPYPVFFQNNLEGRTYGAELTADYQVTAGWRLHAGYNRLDEHLHPSNGQTDATGSLNETADPRYQGEVRSSWELPAHVELDAMLRWVGAYKMDNGPAGGPVSAVVPAYHELGARIAWRPIPPLGLSLIGQNLLHRYHQEYGYPGPGTEAIRRSVYGKVTWRY